MINSKKKNIISMKTNLEGKEEYTGKQRNTYHEISLALYLMKHDFYYYIGIGKNNLEIHTYRNYG